MRTRRPLITDDVHCASFRTSVSAVAASGFVREAWTVAVSWKNGQQADGIIVGAAFHRRILWNASGVGTEEDIQLRRSLELVERGIMARAGERRPTIH